MSVEAQQGSWNEDFQTPEERSASSNDGKGRIGWMKFDKPGEYRIRLCGTHVLFYRWWSPFTTRVITHLSFKDQDKAWQDGHWPRKTFAIHIIDRNEVTDECPTGSLKILEKGNSIFKEFAKHGRVNKVNPSGKEGCDFVIEVTWPENKKRNANYEVTACSGTTPYTAQEVAMIKEGYVPLKEMYKSTPLEEINRLYDELPAASKIPPERDGNKSVAQETTPVTTAATPAPQEQMANSPADSGDDDLFGDDDASTSF